MEKNEGLSEISIKTDKSQWLSQIKALIGSNEEYLMQQMQHYAIEREYSRYTSILKEAWRQSINGLSASFITALSSTVDGDLELSPDEDYTKDPAAAFGILEAKRHRERGVSLEMFLGLLKYYRQAYQDLFQSNSDTLPETGQAVNLLHRFFDRLEIGFCSEWATSKDKHQEELQETNRRITNEKNRYVILFESLPQPVILLTPDLKVENINFAAASLLDGTTTPGGHYYSNASDVPPGSDRSRRKASEYSKSDCNCLLEGISAEVKAFLKRETVEHDFEKKVVLKTKELDLEIRLAKYLDFVGRLKGIIVFIRDLTEKKRVEAEQEHIRSQLMQSDKMACIGQLAAGVAHEINNPIGFVSSNINRLREYMQDVTEMLNGYQELANAAEGVLASPPTMENLKAVLQKVQTHAEKLDIDFVLEDILELIDESKDGADRIRQIVRDLKDFAHPGEDRPKWTNINNCLLSTVNVVRNEIKYKADLKKDLEELPEVYCMPGKLNQVFMNLIVNASHAIESEGVITIATRHADNRVVITISDDGCGIPTSICQQIFDPFFTTKPVGTGTGLGLHISKQIIDKHQGTIAVDSTPGNGTTFTITLPVEPDFDAAADQSCE